VTGLIFMFTRSSFSLDFSNTVAWSCAHTFLTSIAYWRDRSKYTARNDSNTF